MAYDSLKNIIRQYIKTNGEQEITGQIMQNVLIEMVNQYPSTEGFIRANLSNLANGDILIYDSVGAWYNTPLSSFFNGYATQLWVNQQGYVTSSALAGYIHPTITDLANGDILIWDSVGAWVNTPLDTTISGFGYVKSTGSVAYATSAGSANILGHTVYENPAHALANGDMLVYDSGTGWTNVETSSILSGYATQSWVTSQGYITASALNGYATQSWVTSQGYIQPTLSNLTNGDILVYDSGVNWVNTPISSFLAGYATESWVNQQGFLTSSALNGYIHPTLTNLANGDILVYDSVGAWVNVSKTNFLAGYATTSQLADYLPLTGGTVTGAVNLATNSGNVGIGTSSPVHNLDIIGYGSDTSFHIRNLTNSSESFTILRLGNDSYGTALVAFVNSSTRTNDGGTNTATIRNDIGTLRIGKDSYVTYFEASSVGIGTSNPAYKLDVNGTLNATTIYQNGTALSSIFLTPNLSNLANGDILVYDTVGAWYNTSLSSFGFATQTWVGQQGYLTSSALAGYIHPTLTNLANGDILIYDSVGAWVNTNLNTTVAGFGYITSSALAGYLPLTGGTVTGAVNLAINSGNVGIGTTTPTQKLDVNGCISIKNDNYITVGNDRFIYHYYDSSNAENNLSILASGGASAGKVQIRPWGMDNDTNATTFASNGNVGFGITNPVYAIDVQRSLSSVDLHLRNISSSSSAYTIIRIGNDVGDKAFLFLNSSTRIEDGGANTFTIRNDSGNLRLGSSYYATYFDSNVGIKTASPSYTLDVNGSANATTLYENGSRVITTANIGSQSVNYATSAGSANILGHTVTENTAHSLSNGDTLVYDAGVAWVNVASGLSDIRQKSVISYEAEPMFEAVANAPAIRFTWKDATYSFRRGIHVGSIAQYWQTTIPEAVTMDNEGMLSMQYDVIALLSTISVAKKVSEHERRIVILERENEELRKELAALKSA